MFRNLVFLLIIRPFHSHNSPFSSHFLFLSRKLQFKFGVSSLEKYTEPLHWHRPSSLLIAGGLFVGCRILFDLYWGMEATKWLLSAGLWLPLPNSLIVLILCTLCVFLCLSSTLVFVLLFVIYHFNFLRR